MQKFHWAVQFIALFVLLTAAYYVSDMLLEKKYSQAPAKTT